MDILLVRRQRLGEPVEPFKCACGRPPSRWETSDLIARCPNCARAEYHLLKFDKTESGDASELVIAARGVVLDDVAAFEHQGFHVIWPEGGRFFPDVPTVTGEMTHPDGSLRYLRVSECSATGEAS